MTLLPPVPMSKRVASALGVVVLCLSLFSCTPASPTASMQEQAEEMITAQINELSPTPAVLGGTFHVTSITWMDDDTAKVEAEDGHITTTLLVNVAMKDGEVAVESVVVPTEDNNTADEGRDEGEFCGGIAAFPCKEGLTCQYDGTYPDAGGTCVKAE